MINSRKKIYSYLEALEIIRKVSNNAYSKIRTKLIGNHTYSYFGYSMSDPYLNRRIVAIDYWRSFEDLIFGIRILLKENSISRIVERAKGVIYKSVRFADNSIVTVLI